MKREESVRRGTRLLREEGLPITTNGSPESNTLNRESFGSDDVIPTIPQVDGRETTDMNNDSPSNSEYKIGRSMYFLHLFII